MRRCRVRKTEGKTLVRSQLPFADIVEKFLRTRVPKLGAATQSKYRLHISNHIVPYFGRMRMVDITTETIDSWLEDKSQPYIDSSGKGRPGLSWNTRTDLRNILSGIFAKAREWKLFEGPSPIEGVDVGRKKVVREKRLVSAEDLVRLLAVVEPNVRIMILLGFYCGLRISEILALQWFDVDLEAGTVSVARRWHRGDMDDPKSEDSRRVRQLGPLVEELRLYQALSVESKGLAVKAKNKPADYDARFDSRVAHPEFWLFTDAKGDLLDDRDLLQHKMRRHAKEIGFYWRGFGWHTFRRQNITWRQESGATPFEAQKMAGHAKPDMTWIYTLTDAKREKEQLGKMKERLMKQDSSSPAEAGPNARTVQ